jgi:hypothetical protein
VSDTPMSTTAGQDSISGFSVLQSVFLAGNNGASKMQLDVQPLQARSPVDAPLSGTSAFNRIHKGQRLRLRQTIRLFSSESYPRTSGNMLQWESLACKCAWQSLPTSGLANIYMRCPSLAAHTMLRHDILKGIVRRVVHRAVIASTQDPSLCRLAGPAGGAGTSATGASNRVEARGDILLALPGGITIADISITHPLAINTLAAAARMAGAAAARRDQQKRATYSRVEPNGYPFVPFSVESYGRIGQPAMKLLHALGDEAAGPGGVTRAPFVAGAMREIGIGLCRGNFFVYRACLGMFAKSNGTGFRAGISVPTDEHGLL